jgi:hypothetical protein
MDDHNIIFRLRHDRSTHAHPNFSKRSILTEIVFICLGLIPFLQACKMVEATKERENMSMTETNPVRYMAKPPIDASAPVRTETATFALG